MKAHIRMLLDKPLATAAVAACAVAMVVAAPVVAQDKVVAKISSTPGPDSINAEQMEMFANMIDLYTRGTVDGQVFNSSVLGRERAQLEGLVVGTHDIFLHISSITGKFPAVRFWDLPFLFEDSSQLVRLINSDIVQDWETHMAKDEIVYLATWGYGYRQFTVRNKPYVRPADLRGQKHRIPGGKSKQLVFETLGASPSTVAFAELYQALGQGVVDSQDNPLDQNYVTKFHEVTNYLSALDYMYNPLILIAGKPFWERMSPEQQDAVMRAARDIQGWSFELAEKRDLTALEKMLAENPKLEVNYMDPAIFPEWREASKPVYAAFAEETSQEYLDAIISVLQKGNYYTAPVWN